MTMNGITESVLYYPSRLEENNVEKEALEAAAKRQ